MANDKVLSIRADDETIERLNAIAEQSGMKKNELLAALMATYESNRLREAIPEHADDLDNLRALLKKIEHAFVSAYDFAANSEDRARASYDKQIEIYEQTITELRDKLQAAEEQRAAKEKAVKDVQAERDQLEKALEQERKLTQSQATSIDGMRAAKDSLENRVLELEKQLKAMPAMRECAEQDAAKIAGLEKQLAETVRKYEQCILDERKQHSDEMEAVRNRLNGKLEEARDRYDALQKQLSDELAESRRKLSEADDATRAKMDAALAQTEERHKEEIAHWERRTAQLETILQSRLAEVQADSKKGPEQA